jgi:acetoin utilization deacetylase AcuC-like enzyme
MPAFCAALSSVALARARARSASSACHRSAARHVLRRMSDQRSVAPAAQAADKTAAQVGEKHGGSSAAAGVRAASAVVTPVASGPEAALPSWAVHAPAPAASTETLSSARGRDDGQRRAPEASVSSAAAAGGMAGPDALRADPVATAAADSTGGKASAPDAEEPVAGTDAASEEPLAVRDAVETEADAKLNTEQKVKPDGKPEVEPVPELEVRRTAGTNGPARRVRIIYSDAFLEHSAPRGSHPERPERLRVCVDALRKDPRLIDVLDWVEPTPVDPGTPRRDLVIECIKVVHTYPEYLEELEEKSKNGGGWIDGDTYVIPGTYEIALLAVSAWLDAVDYALSDEGGPVWALVRPPGHHATRVTGMGFCLLSNAAISAYYALRRIGAVGIIDFDVHHGNGTEHAVKDEPRIRFTSSHQYPLYPGTGHPDYTGPHNTILNIPLEEGSGMDSYRDLLKEKMLPHALFHSEPVDPPGLVIVSAGFDTLDVDPLASLEFKVGDFEEICENIVAATSATANHERIILGLEGGYNLGPNGLGAAVVSSTYGLAGI